MIRLLVTNVIIILLCHLVKLLPDILLFSYFKIINYKIIKIIKL